MKTTKGGKVMNPTDAYRKELRKKELKRNKKERKKVREVGILKKDPEALKDQIEKLEMMKADGALDKARKHKKRQLEDTLKLVMKKRKEYEEKLREKGETPMFSHLGPVRRHTAEEENAKHPKPEDSVYYHPTLNPTGAPPPGKPPMYKSTIGPRIPLGTSSAAASSSKSELDEESLDVLSPTDLVSAEDSERPKSPPVPLETPSIPKAHVELDSLASGLPLPPPPPPLPGPPPKEQVGVQSIRPLPPPPPPPSVGHTERGSQQNRIPGDHGFGESNNPAGRLPPPPPPPGLPVTQANQNPESIKSDSSIVAAATDFSTLNSLPPLPPRLPPPPPPPRHLMVHAMQPDGTSLGVDRIPPPPDMRHTMPVPGLPNRPPPPPPGILPPTIARPFPIPPGVPSMPPVPMMNMIRPPPPPGLPDSDHAFPRPSAPFKPSYVKSAASTVVKRPLAQHTPELTAMVPASVRVKRESAIPKPKSKTQNAKVTSTPHPSPVIVARSEPAATAPASKPQNIDDSYMAFLEDMKALGALDG